MWCKYVTFSSLNSEHDTDRGVYGLYGLYGLYGMPAGMYAKSQSFGVQNKKSWFDSMMKDVTLLDLSRNSSGGTRVVDVSEPDIGTKYKRSVDGRMKEVFVTISLDSTDPESSMMKDFLAAVHKHTMGETGKASETVESRPGVVQFVGAPKPQLLKSSVGPFESEAAMKVNGNSVASSYCNLTLKCIYDYIDNGSMFKPVDNFCLMHGGLIVDANGKAIFERCVDNAMERIMSGKEVKATDVKQSATFNDVHQLGFGGSVITGRLAVEEACTGSSKALEAMHPLVRTTVVGHTPQWLGIPTIIRETPNQDKFLVALDTQFSDRQKNTHSLGLYQDGSFVLVGKWMGVFEYEANSSDIHIGQKIKVERVVSRMNELETPYYRVIARVTGQVSNLYIAVNYALNPANKFAPGYTTVCLVRFFKENEAGPFKAEVVKPDDALVLNSKKDFVFEGKIELDSYYHANAPAINNEMQSKYYRINYASGNGIANDFTTFVCGDIEASVDFLHAFVMHSYKMLTNQTFPPEYLPDRNKVWANGSADIDENYDLPEVMSLGFDAKTISDKMKEIMHVSRELEIRANQTKNTRIATFACIGDVIGDPVGKGNLDHVSGTELIHEFMCVHWANRFCQHKIVGNRDINKLRFLQEIPYIAKPEHLQYLDLISQYQREFAAGNQTNVVTLKRLLGHFCYPYVASGSVKDEQGNAVNVNKSFARDSAIVPFRKGADGATPYPATIWETFP